MIITKLKKSYKMTRERLRDWFMIEVPTFFVKEQKEGQIIPRFYLPVRKPFDKYGYDAWIFPLAIPVWAYYILTDILYCLWRDCLDWQQMMKDWRQAKTPKTKDEHDYDDEFWY